MPIALANISWKTYMINGAWDVVVLVMIVLWWVETKGKTLEEIDELIEGSKHSNVPDLDQIIRGNEKYLADAAVNDGIDEKHSVEDA